MALFRRRPSTRCAMCLTGHHHTFKVTGCTCCAEISPVAQSTAGGPPSPRSASELTSSSITANCRGRNPRRLA